MGEIPHRPRRLKKYRADSNSSPLRVCQNEVRLTAHPFAAKLFSKLAQNSSQIPASPSVSTFHLSIQFEARMAIALAALGVILMATNPWFTAVDDEVVIADVAARPALQTIKVFLGGSGQHEHPPLSDLFLHGWLWLTNANLHLLRLPSVVFYLLGIWFLVQTARHIGGDRAGHGTLALLLFWPYGFHYGRIAGWYAFTFMLVSLLTLIYVQYLEDRSLRTWFLLVICALALIYTNYFGWAVLGCLGLDLLSRFWRDTRAWLLLAATGALLVFACLPILPAFLHELHKGAKPAPPSISAVAVGVYNIYCLFVSESVAPWFWLLSVAAGLAIACAMVLAPIYSGSAARRFLLLFLALLGVMTFLQIGNTKRMMMISPWLILPIGVALASAALPTARRCLTLSLILVAAIGWYGIFARNLYAGPHWVEPWEQVSLRAAEVARSGGIAIGNNPSLFFYLTYRLPSTNPSLNGHFTGFLPTSLRAPNVFTPQQWVDAGRPLANKVVLYDGLSFEVPGATMDDVRQLLSPPCQAAGEEHLVHDSGARWKQEYQPITGQRAWRIQISTYSCPSP